MSSSPPIKVLMISAAGELGGAERSFLELIRALPADRVAAQACVPPETPLARELKLSGIQVHDVPIERVRRTLDPLEMLRQLRMLGRSSRAIAEICAREKIVLIHANTTQAAISAWQAARVSKIPFVWHCRDILRQRTLNRALAKRAAGIVAISTAVETHLIDQGISAKSVTRIENGIDLNRFKTLDKTAREKIRKELNIAEDTPVLLDVGALVPWKKHEVFFEVLAAVRQKIPVALGLLAGSDNFGLNTSYSRSLAQHAKKLGLDDSLKILGERSDVPELLAAADVLISTSNNEPFGRVLAEAGATALPVVAMNSGAKAEIVLDGKTGFLVTPGDVEGLAKATISLLQQPDLRRRIGEAARRRIAEKFDIQRTAEELTTLFEKVARGSKVKP